MRKRLFAAALLVAAAPAQAAPADDLQGVIADEWTWFLQSNPVYASALGVHTYD